MKLTYTYSLLILAVFLITACLPLVEYETEEFIVEEGVRALHFIEKEIEATIKTPVLTDEERARFRDYEREDDE